jgi:hypothetical protein
MTEVEVIKHEVAKAMTRAYPPVIVAIKPHRQASA